MEYPYTEDAVLDFIDDYERAWGVAVPYNDAYLMLTLYDGLCLLLERYEGDHEGDCLPLRMMR